MKYYVGIDVSKAQLDVNWNGGAKIFSNDQSGIKQFINDLKELNTAGKLALVICEATGGYEQKIAHACHKEQLPIHVAHANKVRYFAKSQGLLAKTDKLDAKVISDYGRSFNIKADSFLLTKNTEEIKELLKRREQLQADKKRETNRLDKISNKVIEKSIQDHIKWLDKKISIIGKGLNELKQAEDVKKDHQLLTSIPAIGDISAYYFLSYLPEIGKLSHKALAALVGVAPYNMDSGKREGKRFIKGGRSHLRQILYMASITAIRCNHDLKTFYERLRSNGKPGKVAIIAVLRKLISMANSVLKRQSPWREQYQA